MNEETKAAMIRRASTRGAYNQDEGEGVLAPAVPSSTKVTVSGLRFGETMSINLDPAEYMGMPLGEIADTIRTMANSEGFDPDDARSSAQEVYEQAQLLELASAPVEFGYDVTV